VGKKEVKFQYLRQFFIETPPAVTDAASRYASEASAFQASFTSRWK
jgi:hypothetical protein